MTFRVAIRETEDTVRGDIQIRYICDEYTDPILLKWVDEKSWTEDSRYSIMEYSVSVESPNPVRALSDGIDCLDVYFRARNGFGITDLYNYDEEGKSADLPNNRKERSICHR